MPSTEVALRQLISLSGITVPEDEVPELLEAFEATLEQIDNIYTVPVGDTPPTSMLRVEV